jgi:peptidyl-prolyl cis-trans isomerase B (cyclophilin B)
MVCFIQRTKCLANYSRKEPTLIITHVPTPWLDGKHAIFGSVDSQKDQDVVNAIKQGDKITSIEIVDSPESLFAAQATQIAAWNKVLGK